MAAEQYRVRFTSKAWSDLEAIAAYWTAKGEPERGTQYARNLPEEAVSQLSSPIVANACRSLGSKLYPQTRELPVFKGSYRILFTILDEEGVVQVLRFWHGRRKGPPSLEA